MKCVAALVRPLCLLVACVLAPGLNGPARAAPLPPPLPAPAGAAASSRAVSEGNLLLVEVRLDQHVLSDSLTAYQSGTQVFLPLGELARLLTIAIRSQAAEGTARGFVRGESRNFLLDVGQGTVSIGGIVGRFDPALVSVRQDDIYVDSSLLGAWLLVDFETSLSNLSVGARPREPLPLQQRLLREAQTNALGQRAMMDLPQYPLMAQPYALAGLPFIDQTFSAGASRANGSGAASAASTTFMKGDLLGLQAAAFIGVSTRRDDRLTRLTVGRSDPQGELLGPLRASAFALGSVAVPGLTHVTGTSDTGNGFSITNSPLDRPTSFNSHTLQGDLPPGWDVELFFNEALVAYQQARADGKYVFADQPLVYGANDFRLVFHGPQGQLRVERTSFLIDETIARPGSVYYTAAAHRDHFGRIQSALHAEAGLGFGLTAAADSLTRHAGFAAAGDGTGADGAARYDSVSLRGFAGSVVYTTALTRNQAGGTLAQAGIKTRLGGLTVDAEHDVLRDFSSDLLQASIDPLRFRDRLRVDGMLPGSLLRSMPLTLELQRDQFASGANSLGATALVSRSVADMSFSNLLHLNSMAGIRTLDGALQVATNIGQSQLRGQLGYLLKPDARLTSLVLASDRVLGDGYLLNVSAIRTFADGGLRLNASVNRSFGSFAIAVNAGLGRHGEAQFGLQVFTSVGRDPRKSQWLFDAVPMTGSGAVSARVFIDRNGNGVMDEGETPVADAGFVINGSQFGPRTGADGIALLDHLPADRFVNLSVNVGTLDDPQLSAKGHGVRLVPRQGNVAQIDFPLAMTGEIDGTVFLQEGAAKRGIGNVLLELVGGSGSGTAERVVAEVRSSADGFFILQEVLPGTYQLRVAARQVEELRLEMPAVRTVRIGENGSLINGQNFLLVPR